MNDPHRIRPSTESDCSRWPWRYAAIVAGGLAVIAGTLAWLGQPVWCACGEGSPIALDVWSSHNSQHAIDPYTITHVSHGLLFFVALGWLAKQLSSWSRFAIAAAIETFWEVIENTPLIINRYREATISLEYFGDSITNSCFDLLACLGGYVIASRLGWQIAIGIFVASELVMLVWIRDSLLLNVIMLVSPVDAIREWQSAIAP